MVGAEASRSLNSTMQRAKSSGMLQRTGEVSLGGGATTPEGALTKYSPPPAVPKHLSVHALTKKRKLPASTGNLHGYLAEDYHQLSWPLPKMFGEEKYGHSLVDITDPRHIKDCAGMSKRLVRLSYDQQIIDLEWRKTYKALLDAEHRMATLSTNAPQKSKDLIKKEVDGHMKYLLELQEQKDTYENEHQTVYSRCDDIKRTLKKESDLENLRAHMERRTQQAVDPGSPFWQTKFNIYRSSGAARPGRA